MLSKQWIVLVIVLGLALLGSCQGEGKNKNKGKNKETDISKNLCQNVTLAEQQLRLDLADQRFNVIFKKKGERVCNSTVKKLTKLPRKLRTRGVKATVHVNNCRHSVKLISSDLNREGLEWVCSQKKIKSVTHDPAPPVSPQTGGDPDEGIIPIIG